jgi:hypothetical protein
MQEKILELKKKFPDYGYKKIAKLVGCSPNLVKYHLNPTLKPHYYSRQTLNRSIQMHNLKKEHGGRCAICFYKKCFDVLCFHHKNPKEKIDNVTAILRKFGIQKAKEEAKKCILLCANCHGEIHAEVIKLESKQGNAPCT